MNKTGFFILSVIIFLSACTVEESGLYGDDNQQFFKTLKVNKQKAFQIIDSGGDKKDSLLFFVKHFDQQGALIEEINYQPDGITVDNQKKYNYNQSVKEISSEFTYYPNNYRSTANTLKRKINYDKQGFQKEIVVLDGVAKKSVKVECDKKGNVKKKTTFNSKKKRTEVENYKYNNNNELIKWEIKNKKIGKIKYIYQYDDNGNLSKTFIYKNNELTSNYTYDYDLDGNLAMEIGFTPEGQADYISVYKYFSNGLLKSRSNEYLMLKSTGKEERIKYHYVFYD